MMSETIEIVVRSAAPQAERAVNDAMLQLLARMAPLGLPPAAIAAMTWEAENPAAFDPGRRVIDIAVRDAIAGFLPRVTLRPGPPGLTVTATIDTQRPDTTRPAWRGFSAPDLARAYAARSQVPDLQAVFEAWRARTAAFTASQTHPALDVVYGPGPNETLDLFYPAGPRSGPLPLWVFIHGGFWQAMDKNLHGHFAAGMLAAGFAVAVPNYELAPAIDLAGIVDQMLRCMAFLHGRAASFGLDPEAIHVSGHSAGGHLAAMLASDPRTGFVRSALPISGLFDLEPMSLLPMRRLLGLDTPRIVAELSPTRRALLARCAVEIAVGAGELPEFIRQSDEIAMIWGCPAAHHVPGKHHFDVVDELADGGPLLDQALRLAGTRRPTT
jgi:arylformamidase